LQAHKVCAQYAASALVLDQVSVSLHPGELVVVLGPNGSGKSSLVRALAGLLRLHSGSVSLEGQDIFQLPRPQVARRLAIVPQQVDVPLGYSVREVVAMGRAPHQSWWMIPTPEDERVIQAVLGRTELEPLADRSMTELSGGEARRVAIARALAQDAPVMLLDEPAAFLDIHHAQLLYELLRTEVRERKLACLMVAHDLNVASQYADRVILMRQAKVVASGSIEEVMTYRRLKEVFQAELYVGQNELNGTRYFVPMSVSAEKPILTSKSDGQGYQTTSGEHQHDKRGNNPPLNAMFCFGGTNGCGNRSGWRNPTLRFGMFYLSEEQFRCWPRYLGCCICKPCQRYLLG
jgi:iron complex transport system ATP-binding protein